jgi:hypothetical protein
MGKVVVLWTGVFSRQWCLCFVKFLEVGCCLLSTFLRRTVSEGLDLEWSVDLGWVKALAGVLWWQEYWSDGMEGFCGGGLLFSVYFP